MDKLPNELLNFIFTDLHLTQKQECMLVCHRWSNVIRSTCLFSTVHINEIHGINKITDILDKNPSYRTQIKSLANYGPIPITISDRQLLEDYPLLRHIYIKGSALQLQNTITKDDVLLSKFYSWRNQLEIIEQTIPTEANNSLLLSGLMSGLKTLIINYNYVPQLYANIAVNTPNLNSLTIVGALISTTDLELLHGGLKALKSLTLKNARLTIAHTIVEPTDTSSLRALSIDFRKVDCSIAVKWLQYIIKKYPQLLHLRFVFSWSTSISYHYETEIINSGILPLVQNLGDRLKSLDISTSDEIKRVIEMLNTFDFDFEMLRLNSLFSNSRTSFEYLREIGRYVRHLSVTLTNFSRSKINSFKQIPMLKTLRVCSMQNISYYDDSLYLDEILDLFPITLESLETYNFTVNCRTKPSSTYHLKKLAIHSKSISQVVYKFISSCLPDLHSLKIDLQYPSYNRILLKDVNLKYLNISVKDKQCILIRTLIDDARSYYPLRDYESPEFDCSETNDDQHLDLVKRSTSQTSELVFEFTCNSVNSLIINNQLAL